MIQAVSAREGDVEARERLLSPGEVATLFRVDPKTVTRWAAAGRISSIRTPGGHRRFREAEVRALLAGEPVTPRPLPNEPAGSDQATPENVAPEPRTPPAAERSSAAPG